MHPGICNEVRDQSSCVLSRYALGRDDGHVLKAPPTSMPRGQHLFFSSGDLIADRRYQYARDLQARGDVEAAADLLAQAVERAPAFAPAWFTLGDLHERGGDCVAAIAAFERALAADPDDRRGARLRLARLGCGDAADAMSPAYVRAVFDQHAADFDAALRDGLAYRGPELLRAALARVIAAQSRPFRFHRALDLGCGTGLMGGALQGAFDHMLGVDLSPGMIEAARRKGIYTELAVADMLGSLGRQTSTADLIVAADAFVYLADLTPVCRAAARVLSPGGLLAFTVETHEGPGVMLGETLRYAHSADHVCDALEQAALEILEFECASKRTEAGVPVPGLVAVGARR